MEMSLGIRSGCLLNPRAHSSMQESRVVRVGVRAQTKHLESTKAVAQMCLRQRFPTTQVDQGSHEELVADVMLHWRESH